MASTDEAVAAVGRRQFARHLSGFTLATLASRILGYARDAAIAFVFGGGSLTDCYYAAFRIANFLRRTLGEGALNACFVPVFTAERRKGHVAAREFFASLWTGLAVVTGSLVLLGIWQARPIVLSLTYGFAADPAKLELTVSLTRILFPHFFFVTAAALTQGALFSLRHFFWPALSPLAFSAAILVYLGLFRSGSLPLDDLHAGVLGLAAAATAGSALQWLLQLPLLRREGFQPAFRSPAAHPGVRQVLTLMGPALVGVAMDQVDALVDTVFASFLRSGSITAIYNSNRLMQLPLALFGVSTATVALTHLSEHAGRGEILAFRRTLEDALRLTAFILLPACAGLIVIAQPCVQLLFEHGAFTPQATRLTAGVLAFYSLGLLAYAWAKVLVMAHYSLRDSATPVKAGCAKVVLNIFFCLALVGPMEVNGLALAASLSSWLCVGWLLWTLHLKVRLPEGLLQGILLPLVASLAMAIGCLLLRFGLTRLLPVPAWLDVAATISFAVPAYYGMAALLGIPERRILLEVLLRRSPQLEETD